MKLSQPELWVIDWVLCGQGEHVTGELMNSLMSDRELRERVWRAQLRAELDTNDPVNPADATLELSDRECEELLALAPTTFRWGSGEDVGFALKHRLALEVYGEQVRASHQTDALLTSALGGGTSPAAPSHDEMGG